jgi:hypothetical protein
MNNKTKANYNITKSVLKEFGTVTKEKAINKSGLIELLICEWIKQQKKQ